MAVVTGKSDLIKDPRLGEAARDPMFARGRPIVAKFTVTNLSTDNSGSKYLLAELPSDCTLDIGTAFKVDGWGFATIRIGTKTDNDALVDVARSAAAQHVPLANGDAKDGKQLWEQLGLAADPGGTIGIWAHGVADATGAGTMKGRFEYLYR